MARGAYYSDLVDALRETIRKLEETDPNDPALIDLKKAIVLALARLEAGGSTSMAAD